MTKPIPLEEMPANNLVRLYQWLKKRDALAHNSDKKFPLPIYK